MPDFSLVPVDHQPDFTDVSFVPVDHDPFSADGMIEQARTQLEGQPQRLATGAGLPDVGAPAVDWSRYNQPFGELKAATYTPTQRIGNLVADALMGLGMQPYTASDLTSRVGNVVAASPLGVAGSALDLIDAKRRDDLRGVAIAAAGMIPGARGGGRAAKALAMDLESRLARAKEMRFLTEMPLYHGAGRTFDAIRSVRTDAPGLGLPGVSLTSNPEIANEFAMLARDRGLGEYPQVYKVLHRAENPARLKWSGDEDFGAVSEAIRNAFDRGHDSVVIHNYTTAGGKVGDLFIVRDGNQLRSVNAAFDPAKRDSNNLLYGLAGGATAPLFFTGQDGQGGDGK